MAGRAPVRPKTPHRKAAPTEEEIRQRAHELYLARGGGEGSKEEDWFAAEAELRAGATDVMELQDDPK